jgi:hypothetical protein
VKIRLLPLLFLLASGAALADVHYDFENQQLPAGWVQGATANVSWVTTNSVAATGSYSLRSGAIGDSQTATVAWAGTFDAGTLSFNFRMESESCCDWFELKLDGSVIHSASGMRTAWTEVRKQVPAGTHTIEWSYRKDGSVASGADAVFIDDVRYGAALPLADPLLQRPGALLMSSAGLLTEAVFQQSALRSAEIADAGPLAFGQDGQLYVLNAGQDRIVRFEGTFGTSTSLATNVQIGGDFTATASQLLGGRQGGCGGHVTVFTASGNVVNSTNPNPCQNDWTTAIVRGTDLYVLQRNRLTRRSTAAPAGVIESRELGFEATDMALDADGSLWFAVGDRLVHTTAAGVETERFPLGRYVQFVAIRADGLIATAGYGSYGFLRPDHGVAFWTSTYTDRYDAEFVPGVVADADGDGLPLWWEQAYGFDPALPADAGLDGDGDTLTNAQEYAFKSKPDARDSDGDGAADNLEYTAGTHPQRTDTDGDGLSDGVELVDLGSNPRSIDTDGDTLGDYYEFTHGLNLTVDDRAADPDGDDLSNLAEFQRGTLPLVADSDADGLSDGAEALQYNTNPLDDDSDDDGLDDGPEVLTHLTNPRSGDSDGDGLGDGLEVTTLASNPNSTDSDGDGLPDAWEHEYTLGLTVSNAAADADADGLSNAGEYAAQTHPRQADTDRDQLRDGLEVEIGANPLSPDSDGDRLADGWEYAAGMNALLASDAARDLDADGFSVLEEFWSGSTDTDPASVPLPQAWSTHQGTPSHHGYQAIALPPGAPVLSVRVPVGTTHPVVFGAGALFYAQSAYFASGNALVAVDERTGGERWRKNFGNIYSTNPPAFFDGRVYVQTGNHSGDTYLHAYDGATGNQVFKSPFQAQWENYLAPTVSGDSVYINGGSYGGAYAFHRTTGAQQWFTGLAQYDGWTPAVDGAYAYAYVGGVLEILDKATGLKLGSIDDPLFDWMGWTMDGAPLLGGYGNAIVCEGSHMTSFDLASRSVMWTRTDCGGHNPAAGNGLVFATHGTTLTAIHELTGATVWTASFASNLRENLIVTRTHVIVSDQSSTHLVRLDDQAIETSIPVSGKKTLAPDGRLAIATASSIEVYFLAGTGPEGRVFAHGFE